jgi:hypothetical protein
MLGHEPDENTTGLGPAGIARIGAAKECEEHPCPIKRKPRLEAPSGNSSGQVPSTFADVLLAGVCLTFAILFVPELTGRSRR